MLLQLVFSPICTDISVIFTHTSDPRLMRRECSQGKTSLMLLQLVSSPICTDISVICTHTSDSRLMRRDSRQGKDVFNVVTTCVQSYL
jgi:hypothetical protein